MRIEIASITPRRRALKSGPAQVMFDDFLARASRYTSTESVVFASEAELLAMLGKSASRVSPLFIALDSRGEALTSDQVAARLRRWRDDGAQHLVFAVGPPDGWSTAARAQANFRLSLGAITLPHELALVVLAEQLYRAQTILAGHPYHSGHA